MSNRDAGHDIKEFRKIGIDGERNAQSVGHDNTDVGRNKWKQEGGSHNNQIGGDINNDFLTRDNRFRDNNRIIQAERVIHAEGDIHMHYHSSAYDELLCRYLDLVDRYSRVIEKYTLSQANQ